MCAVCSFMLPLALKMFVHATGVWCFEKHQGVVLICVERKIKKVSLCFLFWSILTRLWSLDNVQENSIYFNCEKTHQCMTVSHTQVLTPFSLRSEKRNSETQFLTNWLIKTDIFKQRMTQEERGGGQMEQIWEEGGGQLSSEALLALRHVIRVLLQRREKRSAC